MDIQFINTNGTVGMEALNSTFGTVYNNIVQMGSSDSVLTSLRSVITATYSGRKIKNEPCCLENTRVAVLDEIYKWANNRQGEPILWISGWAGSGKSTIARTVVRTLQESTQFITANFFFASDEEDRASAQHFVSTIVSQLITGSVEIKNATRKVLEKDRDIVNKSLEDQWRRLLEPAVRGNDDEHGPQIILVVDALDECNERSDIEIILQLLNELCPRRLRFLVTSRPTLNPGRYIKASANYRCITLHVLDRETIDQDLSRFIRHQLGKVEKGWPAEQEVSALVQKAGGLFIWAANACRHIIDGEIISHAKKRVKMILRPSESDTDPVKPDQMLGEIYSTVLHQSVPATLSEMESRNWFYLVRRFLGSVAILYAELPPASLYALVRSEEGSYRHSDNDVHAILKSFGAILHVPENSEDRATPLRLHHPLFRDFLFDGTRCSDPRFVVDKKVAHETILHECLHLLSRSLRRDICNVNDPGIRIQDVQSAYMLSCIPLEVQYACRYWVSHLEASGFQIRDNDPIHTLMNVHVLHWLEVMSWMEKTHELLGALSALDRLSSNSQCPEFHGLIEDILRFTLSTRAVIEQAPLQIYISALAFAPNRSIVRQTFGHTALKWLSCLPEVQDCWGPLLQILNINWDVNSFAYSDNAKLLASVSDQGTILLWDSLTGRHLRTLEGQLAYRVCFSNDGNTLASVSADSVQLWDSTTGLRIWTLEDRRGYKAIAFTEDGNGLIAITFASMIQYWDLEAMKCTRELQVPEKLRSSVALSKNARTMASWSVACVQIWDVNENGCTHKCTIHCAEEKNIIVLSDDGAMLASACSDIQIFDTENGDPLVIIEDLHAVIHALAFSPSNEILAAGLGPSFAIHMWDLITGQCLQILGGHRQPVMALSFLGNDDNIVSGSLDRTVRLWNLEHGQTPEALQSGGTICSLGLSDDELTLAVAYKSGMIHLLNSESGRRFQILKGHRAEITSVIFLKGREVLVSASVDKTIRIWDPDFGECVKILYGHNHAIDYLSLSEDQRILASASMDLTIRLWDMTEDKCVHVLYGHATYIRAVAFSKDSAVLASSSGDGTILIWDAANGRLLHKLTGHATGVNLLAFAHNGLTLASATDDKTVKLWNVQSGEFLAEFPHSRGVSDIAFSSDDESLALVSKDQVILQDLSGGFPTRSDCRISRVEELEQIRLSYDRQYIQTERGTLSLGETNSELPYNDWRRPGSAIYVGDRWITKDGRRLLLIPPAYQFPAHVAVHGRTAVLGYKTGPVVILHFI
ncbi:hypothetical protein BDW72DRAFT_199629 [Aspergillus terricola var. indicus]